MVIIKRDGTAVSFDANKIINAINKAFVEVDGKPIKVCKYFGQDKCRFDHWRTFNRSLWELIRRYGSYYVKATKEE